MNYEEILQIMKPESILFEYTYAYQYIDETCINYPWFPKNRIRLNSQSDCDLILKWEWIIIPSYIYLSCIEIDITTFLSALHSRWIFYDSEKIDNKFYDSYAFENKDDAMLFKLKFG